MNNTVKAPQFGIKMDGDVNPDLLMDTPTSRYRDKTGWLICNTSLGCGSRVLQGWSSGIGIAADNKADFERKLFELLYLSNNQKYAKDKWTSTNLGRSVEAPISVSMFRYQFLTKGSTYTMNSTKDWVERFEAFINKHNLGTFSKSHEWVNAHYNNAANITAVWTWNGAVPKAADVGITDWKLPE
jgi:hypothetical protein